MLNQKTSISVFVITILVVVITLLMTGLGFISYQLTRQREWKRLRMGLEIQANYLVISLALPVWNFDKGQVNKIIESIMQDDNVYAVEVKLKDATTASYQQQRDENWQITTQAIDFPTSDLIFEEREMLFSGEVIGMVKIWATSKFVEAEVQNNLLYIIAMIITMDIILIVSLYALLWRTVFMPLKQVEQYALDVSFGNRGAVKIEGSQFRGELESLRASINNMAANLNGLVDTLEERVAQRTELLEHQTVELREAKIKADAANQAKSDFLSAMSHELRTPLNGILGYAQILRRKRDLNQDMVSGLNIIYQSGSHLLTLINDILDLSKVEARKMELHDEAVELTSFLGSVVGIIYMRAREKGIEFKQEFKSLPSGVMADEKRLRQILLNLLGNAVKFTAQGAVTLRVSQIVGQALPPSIPPDSGGTKGGWPDSGGTKGGYSLIRFEVEDSGVGIAADQLDKIFQPFEQTGNVKQRSEGTGLGLTISRQLIELMGGTIQVKSELGRGSLFWFELNLPLAAVSQQVVKVVQGSSEILGYEGERRRVLLVDDKASNRYVLQALLEPLGFEISEAENGAVAFEMTLQFRPDLIITDVVMPEMTGFQLIEKIRAMPDLAAIHIIVVSASSFDMREKANTVADYDGYLSKPIDIDKLLELIGQSLGLTWQYEMGLPTEAEAELVPLPQADMTVLYQHVKEGNMRKVRLKGEALLTQLGAEYHPFIKQVLELARGYEEKKLRILLEQYL